MTHATTLTLPDAIIERLYLRLVQRAYRYRDGCTEIRGMTDSKGYPIVRWNEGPKLRQIQAHRLWWMADHGPLEMGELVRQICGNRRCVQHLEKSLQWWDPNQSRRNPGECVNGHSYTEESSSYWQGVRVCKPCNRERCRQYRARQKAKVA